MKSGNLSQPNTEKEDLDATRRTSHQGHPDPTIPTPYAQIIYPCTDSSCPAHTPVLYWRLPLVQYRRHVFSHTYLTYYYSFGQPNYLNKRSISRCDVSKPRSWTCRLASCLCASTSPLQVDFELESTLQMDHHTPVVGTVISVVVSLVSITIISSFLSGSLHPAARPTLLVLLL